MSNDISFLTSTQQRKHFRSMFCISGIQKVCLNDEGFCIRISTVTKIDQLYAFCMNVKYYIIREILRRSNYTKVNITWNGLSPKFLLDHKLFFCMSLCLLFQPHFEAMVLLWWYVLNPMTGNCWTLYFVVS